MAPSPKKKKAVSVTYIPDRSKAVDMGKRFTLKKRRTTIRPITFEMSVAEDDSSMRVSKDSVHDVPGSQPEFLMDDKSQPSVADVQVADQNAEADSAVVYSKDQAERNKLKSGIQTQATPGHQSSMVNVEHQSSMVNVGHQSSSVVNVGHQSSMVNVGHQSSMVNVGQQPLAASLVKAGHQSSINKSARHQSQTMKAGHKSATLEAGRQCLSVKSGRQSVGHQFSVHRTAEDQSSALETISRSPILGAGHRSRAVEAERRSVRHKTAELESVPGNREGHQSPSNNSMFKTSRNSLSGTRRQTSGSSIAQEQVKLQPGFGKENMDCDTVVQSNPTRDTEDTNRSKVPGPSNYHLRSSRPSVETKAPSTVKSTVKGSNVTVDRVKSSSVQLMQPLSDKTDTGFKLALPHTQKNSPLPKDRNAATSRIPSDSNASDIFHAPLPVKGSIYSRPMSTAHTPCDTPMRPPNVSSVPVASTSLSFNMVPVNGQPSGLHVGPVDATINRSAQKKQRKLLPPTANDQPLQDIVITVKRNSSSSSGEDRRTVRPTVSNLSELTVLVSAMEDTVERFISESQPNTGIKRFLRDVTEDAFAKLRRASQASHSINKLNKRLRTSQNALTRKRKELLQLHQERNRLEVEVATAKKEISSGTADRTNRDKINNYLLKLSRLTSGVS